MSKIIDYKFIRDIKTLLDTSKQTVYQNINKIMTKTYFGIVKRIIKGEQYARQR
jgi:hypothetical protein